MDIPQMIKLLSGNNQFNDLILYEAEVLEIGPTQRTVFCRATGGIDIPNIEVSLMSTIGDGSYMIPKIGSTVYIMINPLLNPFIVHYGEVQSVVLTSSETITLNSDEFGGMVKVIELTEKINTLENTVNNLIQLYNTHTHPVAGTTAGPTTMQDTDNITPTERADIENDSIVQGPKIEE